MFAFFGSYFGFTLSAGTRSVILFWPSILAGNVHWRSIWMGGNRIENTSRSNVINMLNERSSLILKYPCLHFNSTAKLHSQTSWFREDTKVVCVLQVFWAHCTGENILCVRPGDWPTNLRMRWTIFLLWLKQIRLCY